MWKEHLKSSSSRQELVPNSQSILTRCTFEEFENSTTRWRRSKLAWRRSSNQTADIPTFIPTACWLHTPSLGSRSDASASFCRARCPASPRSIPTRWHRSKLAWRCFQETWLPYIYLCRVRIRSRRDRQNYLKAKAANQQLLQDQTYESWPKVTSSRTNTRPLRKTGSNPFIEESKDY